MNYKINRAVAEKESEKYPIDLTLISDDEWVEFAHEMIILSRMFNQVDFRKPIKLRVNFRAPKADESEESLVAQMKLGFMLQSQEFYTIECELDSEGVIGQPKRGEMSKTWRGFVVLNDKIRRKYTVTSEIG